MAGGARINKASQIKNGIITDVKLSGLIVPFADAGTGNPGLSNAYAVVKSITPPSKTYVLPLQFEFDADGGAAPAMGETISIEIVFTFDDATTGTLGPYTRDSTNYDKDFSDPVNGVFQDTSSTGVGVSMWSAVTSGKKITQIDLKAKTNQASTTAAVDWGFYGFEY